MTWEEAKQAALQSQRDGNLDRADGQWQEAIKAARQFRQPDPRLCQSLEAYANCLQLRKRNAEAIKPLEESLTLKKLALGERHQAVAWVQNQLARLYYQSHDYENAKQMGEACILTTQAAHGEGSAELATISLNVAYIYHRDKKFDKAEPHYMRAMTLRTKQLGAEHKDTIIVLRDYAKLLREMHRDAEADHLDACVKGTITGSWKIIDFDSGAESLSAVNFCSFCGEKVKGQERCLRCGTPVGAAL